MQDTKENTNMEGLIGEPVKMDNNKKSKYNSQRTESDKNQNQKRKRKRDSVLKEENKKWKKKKYINQ